MKLFNKLKNVLFEVEEIEVPVEEPKVKIAPAEPPKKVERPSFKATEEEQVVTDRELFKAEKTFDFPAFDDHEFDDMKNSVINEDEEKTKSMSLNLIDYEKPKMKKNNVSKERKTEEIKGRAYPIKKEEVRTQKFTPSPVISPVYGVLDKNYRKEDLVVSKKEIDVDSVRKKAFGALEDDLEKSFTKPLKKFYDEPKEEPLKKTYDEPKEEPLKKSYESEKSIEDLLEESSYDSIDVSNKEDSVKIYDEDIKEEDSATLENDLFDLIDSMYDNKEDE